MDGGTEGWRDGQSRALVTRGRDTFLVLPAACGGRGGGDGEGEGEIYRSTGGAAAKQMHRNEKGAEDEKKEGKERKGELQ